MVISVWLICSCGVVSLLLHETVIRKSGYICSGVVYVIRRYRAVAPNPGPLYYRY